MHVTVHETDAMKRLLEFNIWRKKCSAQRYNSRYSSYTTANEWVSSTYMGEIRTYLIELSNENTN